MAMKPVMMAMSPIKMRVWRGALSLVVVTVFFARI